MIEKFKTNAEVIENGDKYLYGNHVRMPLSIERGEGAYVFDKDGNKYLDFIGGIAVNGLGHCHPAIVKCLEERAHTILHCSNYFYNEPAVQTAKLIVENSCFDKVLFANSGAEANEGQIKLARNTPVEFLNKALDMIRRGHNSLVFVCEEGIRRMMMGEGYPEEVARTCDIRGCYEPAPRALGNITGAGHVNMLKPVELVFNDGIDPKTGYFCDCGAAKLAAIHSFREFYAAYMKYLDNIIETTYICSNEFEKYLQYINPAQLYSITIAHSLETAKDAFADGSVYNITSILCAGLGTAVDALMAVKEFVFDRGELTLAEFRDILRNNWEGAEKLRLRILRSRNKYGNGIPEVDCYAAALAHYFGGKLNLRPNSRGGWYQASGHSARTFIIMGERTGATPDGRRAGEEMSKNISPTMGADVNGVTALIDSATAIDSADLPGDFPLDVMMHPATVQGEEGLAAMRTLLYAYLAKYGMAIHFNIFDAAVLEDAQKHPEKYSGLQVRVCGWNVRFNDLAEKEQNAYIERARRIAE